MTQKIQCPKCSTLISIDEVLSHQIEEKMKAEFEKKQQEKEIEFSKKIDSIISEKVSTQLSSEKLKIYKRHQKQALIAEENDRIFPL